MRFENVYFINGTAYAGKSTMVKALAEKYNGRARLDLAYLRAMERSPIKDIEIKYLLKAALTDEINSREI